MDDGGRIRYSGRFSQEARLALIAFDEVELARWPAIFRQDREDEPGNPAPEPRSTQARAFCRLRRFARNPGCGATKSFQRGRGDEIDGFLPFGDELDIFVETAECFT